MRYASLTLRWMVLITGFSRPNMTAVFGKSIYQIDQLSNVLRDRTREDLVFHYRSLTDILSSFLPPRGLIIAMIWYLALHVTWPSCRVFHLVSTVFLYQSVEQVTTFNLLGTSFREDRAERAAIVYGGLNNWPNETIGKEHKQCRLS